MIPNHFCSKYSSLLTEFMELKLGNGYVLTVQIDKEKCSIKGVLSFFKHMELNGGGGGVTFV